MSLARNIGDLPNGDDAPVFACRAWVNFNGTGAVAIRDSGNVSSITDNGTGDYTVTFTTAMPDANYCAVMSLKASSGASALNGKVVTIKYNTDPTATSLRLFSFRTDLNEDFDIISCAIFR